ncbi:MAG: helix-turn-helix domain-containing protein [Alphaproteobacteria bacterium]
MDQQASIGGLIQTWRRARRMSQLDLAGESGISTRHLSFVESGRARPSRGMVLRLSTALRVPARAENEMLLVAGFAPSRRETAYDAPEMAEAIAAVRMLLARHDPYPAVAMDPRWDIVMANAAYAASVNACGPAARGCAPIAAMAVVPPPRPNVLRLLCHPDGLRHQLANWAEVVRDIVDRVRREVARDGDPIRRALLDEALVQPGMPAAEPTPATAPIALIVPVALRAGGRIHRFFSTIATLGTAQDITLQELRIETLHPIDPPTGA